MAESVVIPGSRGNAKIRNPWGVFLLSIVTLWIYYVVWYYKVNRELRDYGVGDSPGTSLLAITLGGLVIVPPWVSWWRFFGRLREAQERAGTSERSDQWIGFILHFIGSFLLPIEVVYAQQNLNRLWQTAH
jgi:hypothetical protein